MDKIKKTPWFKTLLNYSFILIGALLAAYALEGILVPNSILDGGVTGISIILNILLGWKLGLLIFFINIPFLFIGYKNLGKKFLVKAIFSIVVFSLLVEAFHSVGVLTENKLLATIYGSLILGVGVGLVIKAGGCLDGTESVGIVISKNTNISIGQFVLFCNAIIFSVAGFFFGIDRALYSLLAYFITSKIVDYISEGFNSAKAAMIITDNGQEISHLIYKHIGRTVTAINGDGLITGHKSILYCVITRLEINELKSIVMEADASAFITITEVSEIIGNHIKSNKGLKKRKKELR
jgi:uncharacterized membrane-anchored protein YitT (DUF2179 family)